MAQVSLSLTSHFPVSLFFGGKNCGATDCMLLCPLYIHGDRKIQFCAAYKKGGKGESCGQDKSLGGGQWRGEGSSSVRPRPHQTISQPTNPFCPSSSSSSFIAWPFSLSRKRGRRRRPPCTLSPRFTQGRKSPSKKCRTTNGLLQKKKGLLLFFIIFFTAKSVFFLAIVLPGIRSGLLLASAAAPMDH